MPPKVQCSEGGRSALLADIQKGARLKKVMQVNDRSAPALNSEFKSQLFCLLSPDLLVNVHSFSLIADWWQGMVIVRQWHLALNLDLARI